MVRCDGEVNDVGNGAVDEGCEVYRAKSILLSLVVDEGRSGAVGP